MTWPIYTCKNESTDTQHSQNHLSQGSPFLVAISLQSIGFTMHDSCRVHYFLVCWNCLSNVLFFFPLSSATPYFTRMLHNRLTQIIVPWQSTALFLFSNSNNIFLGYFDPISVHNESNYFFGVTLQIHRPKQKYSSYVVISFWLVHL